MIFPPFIHLIVTIIIVGIFMLLGRLLGTKLVLHYLKAVFKNIVMQKNNKNIAMQAK